MAAPFPRLSESGIGIYIKMARRRILQICSIRKKEGE
jgi:hypothetical protein